MRPIHLERQTSQVIAAARVLCIFLVVTTHLWPRPAAILGSELSEASRVFFTIVVTFLGRSSVPLLGVFSGILLVCSLSKVSGMGELVLRKGTTLLLPIVFWSAPVLFLLFLDGRLPGGSSALPPATFRDWLDSLTAAGAYPANGPLHFLRDVFVLCIVGAIVVQMSTISKGAALSYAVGFLAFAFLVDGIMLRPIIGVFYFGGVFLALCGKANWRPPLAAGIVAFVAGEAFRQLVDPDLIGSAAFDFPRRFSITLLMWWFASFAIARSGLFRTAVSRIESHVFVVFCSHVVTATAMSLVLDRTGLSAGDPSFIPIFILQWVICILVGIALSILLKDAWFANGGRYARSTLRGRPSSPTG